MKLNLFQIKPNQEEHADFYYHQMTSDLEHVLAVMQKNVPHIEGKEQDETVLLPVHSIYYLDAVDRRIFACLEKETYTIALTLNEAEQKLEKWNFVRINKSQIVNLHKIKLIKPTAGMRIIAVLENDEQLVISRNYREDFHNSLTSLRRALS